MANQEELERISNELQLNQARGEALRNQLQAMQSAMLELTASMEAIETLDKASKGDTLLPIGSGVFISCPKPDASKVIVSVGGGIMVQKKPEDALKILQERQKRMADAMGNSQAALDEIVKNIERLTVQASSAQIAEERRNVRASKEQAD